MSFACNQLKMTLCFGWITGGPLYHVALQSSIMCLPPRPGDLLCALQSAVAPPV